MKLLVSDSSPGVMAYYEALLANRGFSIKHSNYCSYAGAFGGPCPELWIMNDEDFEAASKLILSQPYPAVAADEPSWKCPKCGEIIEPAFDACWNCSTRRPMRRK